MRGFSRGTRTVNSQINNNNIRGRVQRGMSTNFLKGNWKRIDKLPSNETENLCPVCFAPFFCTENSEHSEVTSNNIKRSESEEPDTNFIGLNPLTSEIQMYQQLAQQQQISKSNESFTVNNSPSERPSIAMHNTTGKASNGNNIRMSIGIEEPVVELPCKHVFHEACIEQWSNQHNNCPLCRFKPDHNDTIVVSANSATTAVPPPVATTATGTVVDYQV